MTEIGIESLSFYTSRYFLDLGKLAEARSIDPNKYSQGLGQEHMGILCPDEDVVTLAATSAKRALETCDPKDIAIVLIATESGVDQSKALGIWVHHLLSLPKTTKVIELKQACYSGCAAIQLSIPYLQLNPDKKVLVIATDNARYGLGTPGEPTQGCGACAMVLSAKPKLVAIEPESGAFTSHVMDFWRPNYRDEALVDGKYSTKIYISALQEAWAAYRENSGRSFHDHSRFCYHIPFSRMAEKAHEKLLKECNITALPEDYDRQVKNSLVYSRKIGNCYTASLFIGLASLLEQTQEDLTNERVGLFSYGSGCVAEFFSARILPNYRKYLKKEAHQKLIQDRTELSVADYEAFYNFRLPEDGSDYKVERYKTGDFRLVGIRNHERLYEPTV